MSKSRYNKLSISPKRTQIVGAGVCALLLEPRQFGSRVYVLNHSVMLSIRVWNIVRTNIYLLNE